MSKYIIRKANIQDCPKILALIKELAVFENAPEEVAIGVKELERDGFTDNSIFDALVAECDNEIVGTAIFYDKYSTWKGRAIYLEDLIVTGDSRGRGIGKALFEAVIKEAKKRNSGRMEWQVLDWNQNAIDFYKSYGADIDSEWLNGRFSKAQLNSIQLT